MGCLLGAVRGCLGVILGTVGGDLGVGWAFEGLGVTTVGRASRRVAGFSASSKARAFSKTKLGVLAAVFVVFVEAARRHQQATLDTSQEPMSNTSAFSTCSAAARSSRLHICSMEFDDFRRRLVGCCLIRVASFFVLVGFP